MKQHKEKQVNITPVFTLVSLCLLAGAVISFCAGKFPISLPEI